MVYKARYKCELKKGVCRQVLQNDPKKEVVRELNTLVS